MTIVMRDKNNEETKNMLIVYNIPPRFSFPEVCDAKSFM